MRAGHSPTFGTLLKALVLSLLFAAAGMPENLRSSALGIDSTEHRHYVSNADERQSEGHPDFAWAECHTGPDCLLIAVFALNPTFAARDMQSVRALLPGSSRYKNWRPLFEPPPPRLVS